ncbi:ciliary microtubule inner protein 4 isoform X2 [Eleutherodactylus coqui]
MSPTELSNWNHCTENHQNGKFGRRRNAPQAQINIQQSDSSNLEAPANSRHKNSSSVVDQLITPEQVRSCLTKEERTECHQGYRIPKLRMKSCFIEDYPHQIYYDLGCCLRSNLFPGASVKQNSLVRDSYTPEVNEKGRLDKHNTHQWYGKKTDELATLSEILVKKKAIAKTLQNQPRPPRALAVPIQTNAPDDVPAPPPPLEPPKKPRIQRHQAKNKKPEMQPPSVSSPKENDDFWNFYDKLIE